MVHGKAGCLAGADWFATRGWAFNKTLRIIRIVWGNEGIQDI